MTTGRESQTRLPSICSFLDGGWHHVGKAQYSNMKLEIRCYPFPGAPSLHGPSLGKILAHEKPNARIQLVKALIQGDSFIRVHVLGNFKLHIIPTAP